jgi:shikimate dehydrogenase
MAVAVDGATRLHIIVGDPIAQVKSPAGMTSAFAAHGHNAVLVPIHVSSRDLPAFLKGASLAQNIDGIIVTIPHKFACYHHCTAASDRAHFLGAVNILRRTPDGGWYGEMFDGLGFVGAVRAAGCDPQELRALLVGAGGAGSAIALALVEAGVRELAIHDADQARRDMLINRLTEKTGTPITVGSPDPTGFDLVAHATPAGMRPGDPMPVDVTRLTPQMLVGCVITSPAVSPMVEAARRIGCRTSVGGDMYAAEQQLMLEFLLAGTGGERSGNRS